MSVIETGRNHLTRRARCVGLAAINTTRSAISSPGTSQREPTNTPCGSTSRSTTVTTMKAEHANAIGQRGSMWIGSATLPADSPSGFGASSTSSTTRANGTHRGASKAGSHRLECCWPTVRRVAAGRPPGRGVVVTCPPYGRGRRVGCLRGGLAMGLTRRELIRNSAYVLGRGRARTAGDGLRNFPGVRGDDSEFTGPVSRPMPRPCSSTSRTLASCTRSADRGAAPAASPDEAQRASPRTVKLPRCRALPGPDGRSLTPEGAWTSSRMTRR